MTQPPGGYPPPPQDPSSGPVPGGYPPPAQPGQAPGYPPAPGPQYGQPPAPQPGGYPPPAQPGGYPPQAQPGGYPPQPPAGGYPPQAPPPGPGQQAGPPPGYSQPNQGYGQPAAAGFGQQPNQPGYPPAGYAQGGYAPQAQGTPQVDLSKVGTLTWIIGGLGLLLLIFSFFGWVSSTYGSAGGWNNWWFLIPLLVLAVVALHALITFGVVKAAQVKPSYLFFGALGIVVLYILALVHIFASYTISTSSLASEACSGLTGESLAACTSSVGSMATGASVGPGFGIWASIVLSLALAYFVGLWAQKTDKLPFKVPGPAL